MQIHEIIAPEKKGRKTVGRGGRRGTYSGRGNKGQKSRSGAKIDPLFEGGRSSLLERLKKVRGFKSIHAKKNTVTLDALEKSFQDGDVVTIDALIDKGLIDRSLAKRGVKILNNGTLQKKLTLSGDISTSLSIESQFSRSKDSVREE